MKDSELALVAIVLGLSFFGLLAYFRSIQPQPSVARGEVWEVQSDKQGMPERVVVKRR